MEKLKPLQWETKTEYGLILRAKTPFGMYSIHEDEGRIGRYLLSFHLTEDADLTIYAEEIAAVYLNPEDMMEFAQEDYEARMMKCFEE